MHRAADSFIVFIREMKFCHFIELHPLGRSKVAPVAESSKDDYALFPFAYIGILNRVRLEGYLGHIVPVYGASIPRGRRTDRFLLP
jgi:hypothetical protein